MIEGEKHQCVAASGAPPAGDSAHSPGLCPDWESNWCPFASQAGTQCTESHQPGPKRSCDCSFFNTLRGSLLKTIQQMDTERRGDCLEDCEGTEPQFPSVVQALNH